MKHEIEQLGRKYARQVLEDSRYQYLSGTEDTNSCEPCGKTEADNTTLHWGGCGVECRACFAESLEYWEDRGGFSSEHIWGKQWDRIPEEDSRVYRVLMSGYFAELGGK
jgi:hypothetical protein